MSWAVATPKYVVQQYSTAISKWRKSARNAHTALLHSIKSLHTAGSQNMVLGLRLHSIKSELMDLYYSQHKGPLSSYFMVGRWGGDVAEIRE